MKTLRTIFFLLSLFFFFTAVFVKVKSIADGVTQYVIAGIVCLIIALLFNKKED